MNEQEPYTPSVKQVRDTYASIYAYTTDRAEAFDRMIEQVRREAAAEQREKDARIAEDSFRSGFGASGEWIAAAIRKQGTSARS